MRYRIALFVRASAIRNYTHESEPVVIFDTFCPPKVSLLVVGKRLVQFLCLPECRTGHLRDLADLEMALFNASGATLDGAIHPLPRRLKRVFASFFEINSGFIPMRPGKNMDANAFAL